MAQVDSWGLEGAPAGLVQYVTEPPSGAGSWSEAQALMAQYAPELMSEHATSESGTGSAVRSSSTSATDVGLGAMLLELLVLLIAFVLRVVLLIAVVVILVLGAGWLVVWLTEAAEAQRAAGNEGRATLLFLLWFIPGFLLYLHVKGR